MESIDISITSPFSANTILCDIILSITTQKNHVLQQSDIIKIFNSCCLFSSLTVCFLSILIRVVVQLWSGLLVWFIKLGQFQNGRVIFHCPEPSLCIPRSSLAVLCRLVKSQNIEEVAGRAEDGQSIKLVVSTTSPFLGLTILYDVLLSKLTLNNYFCSNLTLAFGPGRYSCVAL